MTTKEQNKLSRMILYDQIHRYRAEHKSAQWIAYGLKINPKTVKKYLSISKAEFERNSDSINHRGGVEMHQDIPVAQMHDLPKEHYPDFLAVSSKIIYNYVMKIRKEHGLPTVSVSERQYSCILDTAPGRYS